ncbi:Ig-like domain-containing protein [Methanobacterium sp.]|uniref:Ig-like domain-containing protein n=1 Tax=Methanobacterium sp. TaxID=2164 RepID=UPI003C783D00
MTSCILSKDNIGFSKTPNPGMGGAIYNKGTSTISYNSIPHKDQHPPEDFGDEFDLSIINDGGTVNAELNWWGTNKGPENHIQGFNVTKWFVLTINLPSYILINNNFNITADLRHDNNGTLHTERYLPNGIPVTFYTRLPIQYHLKYVFTSTVNGIAQATFKSAYGGATQFSASVDNQIVAKSTKIIDNIPPKITLTYPKNGATGVSRTNTIIIKFSKNIKASYNWSKIYVKNLNTGRIVSISKSISENKLYIKMNAKRYAYNWYQVYIPKAAVKNYSSYKLKNAYTFKFKTGKYPLTYE